jgi:hypothetical protein
MLTSYEESLILFELHGRKSRSWLVELAGKPLTTPQPFSWTLGSQERLQVYLQPEYTAFCSCVPVRLISSSSLIPLGGESPWFGLLLP